MSKIIGSHIPATMRNLAINGALDYWQNVGANTTTINTASASSYLADMFQYNAIGGTNKNFSMVRSSDVPTFAQAGFQASYSHLFTMLTGLPSFAAGDLIEHFLYKMEGLDYQKIHAKTVTFGFWTKASIAGTYSFSLRNAANNRSYVTTFTAGNTWQFQTITVPMDNTGTWSFSNTLALLVSIGSVAGTTYQTGTLNTWQGGLFITASTATNFMATTNATMRIAMFSIVEGSLGFGATGFARAGDDIMQELAMCQRYYEKSYDVDSIVNDITSNGAYGFAGTGTGYETYVNFKVNKRSVPTCALVNPIAGGNSIRNVSAGTNISYGMNLQGETGFQAGTGVSVTAGQRCIFHWVADARL